MPGTMKLTLTECLTGDWRVTGIPYDLDSTGGKIFDTREEAERWVQDARFLTQGGELFYFTIGKVELRADVLKRMGLPVTPAPVNQAELRHQAKDLFRRMKR